MTGLTNRILRWLADYVPNMITEKVFDLGTISFTAGSLGSTAQVISKSIGKTGYTPIGIFVGFASASVVRFGCFYSQDRATGYVQVIRGQTAAYNSGSVHAKLYVTYLKNL